MRKKEREKLEQDNDRTPGWVLLYRQILESSFWLEDEPYDSRSAFIYVLVSANWKPKTFHARNGQMINLQRGQFFTSISNLAEKFHRSTKWVRGWFTRMNNHGMLTVKTSKMGTLLTVVNYSKYQDRGHTEDMLRTLTSTHSGHTEGTRLKEYKEYDKEGERKEKETPAPSEQPFDGGVIDENGDAWYDDPEEAMRNAII